MPMDRWEEIRHQVAVAGRITDQLDGGPIAGAQVTIETAPAAFTEWLALKALAFGRGWDSLAVRPDRALSKDDGRFHFGDLPDGTYTVTAEWLSQGSRYGTASGGATVSRGAGGTVKLATVDLVLPPTRVSGMVVAKGSKVAMAEVRLKGGGESTFTDGQGGYVLSAIEPGQRTLRVQANGFAPAESGVTVGARGQSVTVDFSLS
jgi:hypothetical protein